jgi:hypothetical protein
MYYFILEQLLLIGIGVMVYVIVRALPLVDEFELAQEKEAKKGKLLPRIKQEWMDILDERSAQYAEKALRRMKVWVLKLDNYVSRHLSNMTSKGRENGDRQASIFEESEKKKKK